jgi:hypothetical protein
MQVSGMSMTMPSARAAPASRLSRFASSCKHHIAIAVAALRPHKHEWHDWYVFDSSAVVTIGGSAPPRIVGQQIMQLCACGQTNRKHLATWRDARIARKRLPYKRWGIWSFSLPVPPALDAPSESTGT